MTEQAKNNPNKYYFLLVSLPNVQRLFSYKQLPIPRHLLDKRLEVLNEKEEEELTYIESIFSENEVPEGETDEEVTRSLEEIIYNVKSPLLRSIVRDIYELRSFIAVLRRRQKGKEYLSREEVFGHFQNQRDRDYIERYWEAPAFKLEPFVSYLPKINKLLDEGESFELEKFIMAMEWEYLTEASRKVYFNFDATAIYVLRWGLINRWIKYNEANPLAEFNKLLDIEYQRAIENLQQENLENENE